jgi:hypothetical protein
VNVEEMMQNYRAKNFLEKVKAGLFVLLVLLFWVNNPLKTWADDANGKKIKETKIPFLQVEDTDSIRSFDRFQIELYGGFLFLNPSDLNLFVSHDNRIQEFSYDSYFDYLVATDQIDSWTKNQGEERKEIRRSYPIGGRLKYYLSETVALSLGFKYMSSSHSMDLEFQYFRNELTDERYNESIRYSPYSLSAKAYIPTLGIHISKKMKN